MPHLFPPPVITYWCHSSFLWAAEQSVKLCIHFLGTLYIYLKKTLFLRSESESFLVEIKMYLALISQAVSRGQGESLAKEMMWPRDTIVRWGLQGADSRLFQEAFSWLLFESEFVVCFAHLWQPVHISLQYSAMTCLCVQWTWDGHILDYKATLFFLKLLQFRE